MIVLKWFSFVWLALAVILSLYRNANEDNAVGFLCNFIVYVPILIYIFLS